MVAINHALTGAFIGLYVANPVLAIVLAIISHFVLDATPHFNANKKVNDWLSDKRFSLMLVIDALLCFGLVLILVIYQPHHYVLAAICAFLATSPDFLQINHFLKARKHLPWKPNFFSKLTGKIQWFQRPIGALVEVVWFISMVRIVSIFI